MAKQKGFIKLKGSLGGLTFYQSAGKDIIRTTGGVDKSRIEKDAAFKRTRENMKEFGASATVGKALRQGYATIIKKAKDTTIVSRITGIMKQINSLGSGIRGQRAFEILTNKVVLEGFEFNKSNPLEAVFYAPFINPTLDANRSIATWVIPDFNASNYIKPPEGATHFKLLLATTVLSNYIYNISTKKYEPTNAVENEVNGFTYSAEIPVTGMVGADTTLTVDLGFGALLPNTVAVLNAIGIVFYQEINTNFYELSSGNAIKIASIG